MASQILRRALDAFARIDTVAAAQIVQDIEAIDSEFRAFVRKFVTHMMEDPWTIAIGLDYLFIAKAIERIGDRPANIAELSSTLLRVLMFVMYPVRSWSATP
jgi:phosphate transport system protein